jgi:hypothetical protein
VVALDGYPTSSQVVGVHVHQDKSSQDIVWNTSILIEYSLPNRFLLLTAAIQSRNGVIQLEGVHLNKMDESMERLARFKWTGQDFVHYLVLTVCILVPLLILVALALCIRTPIPKRKWLWVVFILFGLFRFYFNWNDGTFEFMMHQGANGKTFEFISFQFLGSGFYQNGAFGPWILASSLPLGALVFLYKRKQWHSETLSTLDNNPQNEI